MGLNPAATGAVLGALALARAGEAGRRLDDPDRIAFAEARLERIEVRRLKFSTQRVAHYRYEAEGRDYRDEEPAVAAHFAEPSRLLEASAGQPVPAGRVRFLRDHPAIHRFENESLARPAWQPAACAGVEAVFVAGVAIFIVRARRRRAPSP